MKKKESKRYKKLIDIFKVKKIASLEETIEKMVKEIKGVPIYIEKTIKEK